VENIGCDAIATGHYARSSFGDFLEQYQEGRNVKLLIPMDRVKDQTFFLSTVPQKSLQRTMFPLGNLTKDVVKKIAISASLEQIALKKESMGICFIGKRRNGFSDFLSEYSQPNTGQFVDIETYKVIGTHSGAQFWTIGQGIKMKSLKDKAYVVEKDMDKNIVYVCVGQDHPALYVQNFFTDNPYWIDEPPEELSNRSKDQVMNQLILSQQTADFNHDDDDNL